MRRPGIEWQDEILDDTILEDLQRGVERYEEIIRKFCEIYRDGVDGETPEFIAKNIGFLVYDTDRTGDDITTPVERTDGSEGEKLALGYIGVKGMEMTGIGEPVIYPECHSEST